MADFFRKIFLFFVCMNFSFAQSQTNFEIIDSLINSIADEISTYIKSEKIKIESNLQDKVVENRILSSLLKNFSLFFDDIPDDASVVRLDAFSSKINYIPQSKGLFKGLMIRRNIEVNLYCSAVENGKVLFSRDFKREYFDYIKPDEIQDLEDENFKFTHGKFVRENSIFDKIIEGLIIASSIGIAIYLLFAVRK